MAQNTLFSVNEAKFLKTGLQQAGEKFLNKDFYLWNGYPEILVMTTRWLSVPWASVSTHKLMTALDKTRPDETREFLLGYTGRESPVLCSVSCLTPGRNVSHNTSETQAGLDGNL